VRNFYQFNRTCLLRLWRVALDKVKQKIGKGAPPAQLAGKLFLEIE